MTRPRSTTIYVKKRAVMVERKAVRPRAKSDTGFAKPASKYAENYNFGPSGSLLAEVERCLSHRPIAFPRKLWGEVL